MKRESAVMGLIIPFIEKCTPESKFDTLELELVIQGRPIPVYMDQISIKHINEYPDDEKIVLSIDADGEKYFKNSINESFALDIDEAVDVDERE